MDKNEYGLLQRAAEASEATNIILKEINAYLIQINAYLIQILVSIENTSNLGFPKKTL
jgi:hypothetical protein